MAEVPDEGGFQPARQVCQQRRPRRETSVDVVNNDKRHA